MPTVGMVGDTATEVSHVVPVERCDDRVLIKHWLIVILFTSAFYNEKHMSEGHTQNTDLWK